MRVSTDAVWAAQIQTLYRQSVGIVLVNPLNAAIVAAVLWPSSYPGLLVGWVGVMVVVTVGRVMLRNRYLRSVPPVEETCFQQAAGDGAAGPGSQ